jgi:translocation and assembly module TamA
MWFDYKLSSTAVILTLAMAVIPVAGSTQDTAPESPADASPGIDVVGVSGALADNIRAHIGVPEERCNASQRRLNRLIPGLRDDVRRAAQALGFYRLQQQITITAAQNSQSTADTDRTAAINACWNLTITVETGEPVRFGEVNIALSNPAYHELFRPILNNLPVRAGEQLNHSNYERLKANLSSHAIELGFFQARFVRSELAVNMSENLAAVDIEFDPGERYRFGEITINTPDALSADFIGRFLTFQPGESYASETLIEQRRQFNDSQYFSRVAVTPQLTAAVDNAVPVNVDLSMRPRKAYSAGIGVNTDTGPRVRLNYEDRYINRRGHRLSGDLSLSPLQQEPSISYVIPLQDPVNDSLRFSGGFQRQESDSFITNTYRVGVTYLTLLDNNWVQNIFTNYEREDSELTGVADRSEFKEQTNSLISGINWSRTRSNDAIYPTRGWRLFGQLSGAHTNLLSDMTFAQVYGSAKYVRQTGPGRILLRAEMATTIADEVLELPISVRFFTGGDTSVRGYQFGELGATNDQNEVVGGKHMLVGSIEYDMRVTGNWFAAAFIDSGNSFAAFDDMNLKQSAGLGVRWLSPIGPIRLDIAKGLESGGQYRLHITMGPDL